MRQAGPWEKSATGEGAMTTFLERKAEHPSSEVAVSLTLNVAGVVNEYAGFCCDEVPFNTSLNCQPQTAILLSVKGGVLF